MYSPLNSYVYIHWILDFKYILLLCYTNCMNTDYSRTCLGLGQILLLTFVLILNHVPVVILSCIHDNKLAHGYEYNV